jgi:hypothetical protein
MNTKNMFAIAFAVVAGVSMSTAYADYDHDYRNDHRDVRSDHRDSREYRREHERARYEYRGPRNYVAVRPVYVSSPVVYAQPIQPSLNIVVPIHF